MKVEAAFGGSSRVSMYRVAREILRAARTHVAMLCPWNRRLSRAEVEANAVLGAPVDVGGVRGVVLAHREVESSDRDGAGRHEWLVACADGSERVMHGTHAQLQACVSLGWRQGSPM